MRAVFMMGIKAITFGAPRTQAGFFGRRTSLTEGRGGAPLRPARRQPASVTGRSSTAHALYEGCFDKGSKTASVSRLVSS